MKPGTWPNRSPARPLCVSLKPYHAHGVAGLADLARRPHTQPHRTPDALVAAIVAMKHRHPSFGPKKIRDRLRAVASEEAWPVDSTVGAILKHAGLVRPRRRRLRVPADPQALQGCTAVAQSWSADFKGDFPLGTGQRCYPLTLTDNYSRYLLHCQGLLHPTTAAVQPWFVWVFQEYGLPETMRTDNGPPFASTALGGLSRLAAWWVRLGTYSLSPWARPPPHWPRNNAGSRRLCRNIIGRAPTKPWPAARRAASISSRPGRIP